MLKFVISLVFLFVVVGVFGQSDDYSDFEPINNRHSAQTSPQKSSCAFPCPRGWTYFPLQGICLLPTPELPWVAAEAFCVKLGGNLMSIHGTNSFLNAHKMLGADKNIWIGLNKIYNNEDVWKNSNNATVNYLNWGNNGASKCARIANLGLYREQPCENSYYGICQIYAFA
uniref:C-type lectin domain-containing protein n=1 Tax=Panagrolaimus davidi TaxID=227884 RepID=A0A914Q8R9_9BILA